MAKSPHILIVEARFYDDMADAILQGATKSLEEKGATWDVVTVMGALEIPAAITYAHSGQQAYDGYVALGVIIRGETYHFDIVANESSRALMDMSVDDKLAIGNGIMTVENEAQAWDRVRADKKDKGGFAAKAALTMIELRNKLMGDAQ